MCDPRDIRHQLESSGAKVNGDKHGADSLIQTVQQINTAKVFVACLSDEYVKYVTTNICADTVFHTILHKSKIPSSYEIRTASHKMQHSFQVIL